MVDYSVDKCRSRDIWTHFFSNISIDLMKAALAVLAGVATTVYLTKKTTQIVLARGIGFLVGIAVGGGTGRISNDSIQNGMTQIAQDMAKTYVQIYGTISNPTGVITESGERAKDILVCSATQAGDLAIETIETVVRDNINRAARPFINPIKRFF